jgi:type IV pilus assembly protein PilQ
MCAALAVSAAVVRQRGEGVGEVIDVSLLDSDYLVDLELSALQSEGRGEVVSSPRVITADQKEATIRQGVEIPFQSQQAGAQAGGITTEFKEAVLSLTVTPQITPDERIIMDLDVTNDTIGEQVPSATGGFVPSIDTRQIVTQAVVNNGETVVLGGMYESERRETQSKVPILGDIPGLGVLFRQTARSASKAELLVFVTPKLLKDDARLQ